MIAMTLSPANDLSDDHILEIKIKAPASPEPRPIPVEKVPTLIYIDENIEDEELELVTHALTDTITRVTWANQVQIITSHKNLPTHLAQESIEKEQIFDRAKQVGHCKLLLVTNENSREFNRNVARSSEFLVTAAVIEPNTTIELIDALNDYIKDLKQKTMVNLHIEFELPNEDDTLEPLNYIPNFTKIGNSYFANLIDLASEEEKAYAFKLLSTSGSSRARSRAQFEFEDLVLGRVVSGGQLL